MTTALSLATRLRHTSDPDLITLIEEREISSSGISDFFDLAEILLDSESIQHALSHLERQTLATIAAAKTRSTGNTSNRLHNVVERLRSVGQVPVQSQKDVRTQLQLAHRLALLDINEQGHITVYDAVTDRLDAWPHEGLPDMKSLASDPQPAILAPVSRIHRTNFGGIRAERIATEHAFSTVTAITEILSELSRNSAKELSKGGLSLPDTKRLASGAALDLQDIGPLMSIASRTELVMLDGNEWVPSAKAETWLSCSFSERWRMLAESWLTRLPHDIRRVLTDLADADWGPHFIEHLHWLYPAAGDWMMGRVSIQIRNASLLGLTNTTSKSYIGRLMLTEGIDAAQAAIADTFPATVDKVFLQNDLSIISPGPLEASIDARLRVLADVEARALACTYRISATGVTRALAAGESATSILNFLEHISRTGIPQPVRYLVNETASRYGLVRVGFIDSNPEDSLPPTFHSYIRSKDESIIRAIEVDRTLSVLALRRANTHELVSRFSLDIVFRALNDARYPAAAEDENEVIITLQQRQSHKTTAEPPLSDAALLVEQLRVTSMELPEGNEEAWLVKQIDVAIRNKLSLIVSVSMPDGSLTDFLLEPTSVARGRLRARDRGADIERTLPITSISAIRPAE
jgi:hypothetical protein